MTVLITGSIVDAYGLSIRGQFFANDMDRTQTDEPDLSDSSRHRQQKNTSTWGMVVVFDGVVCVMFVIIGAKQRCSVFTDVIKQNK